MRALSISLAVANLFLLLGWQVSKAATPQEHTSRLANGDPWTSGSYQLGGGSNSRQANQYGPSIGSPSASIATPASPLDRVQGAVVGTAGTLRDGVEAGIQQANQQISQAGSQVLNSTVNASRDLSGQVQNITGGRGTSQTPQSSAPTWPAPPPALSSASGMASSSSPSSNLQPIGPATGSGWTSIRADMAPPRLLPPPLAPLNASATSSAASSNAGGFNAPLAAPPLSSSGSLSNQYHSVLTDSMASQRPSNTGSNGANSTATSAPDWSSSWGSAPSPFTAGRSSDSTVSRSSGDLSPGANSALPRVGPEIPRPSTGSTTSDADFWNRPAPALSSASGPARSTPSATASLDRYGQPIAPTQNGSNLWAESSSAQAAPSVASSPGPFNNPFGTNQPTGNLSASPNPLGVNQPVNSQPVLGQQNPPMATTNQPLGNMPTLGVGNTAGLPGAQGMNPDQLPWIPLLAASVSLAGSLGANLYLGWSYADARHRYHLLVRKTTESFHRSAAA
jgi:hypothetical protein